MIMEALRAQSTLFFRQEKGLHDLSAAQVRFLLLSDRCGRLLAAEDGQGGGDARTDGEA
jgi:hypothetical protein